MDPAAIRTELQNALGKAREGDYSGAKADLERLTQEIPDFADGHYYLGLVFERLGESGPARTAFSKALELDPFHEEARNRLRELAVPPASGESPFPPPTSAAERLGAPVEPPPQAVNPEAVDGYYHYAVAPAGFWIRVGGYIVDSLLFFLAFEPVNRILQIQFAEAFEQLENLDEEDFIALFEADPSAILRVFLFPLLVVGFNVVFEGFLYCYFHYASGQTPGKRLLGIRVVDAGDLGYLSGLQAFGRYLAAGLSWLICSAGYAMVAFQQEKRGLHDLIAGTRVVYSESVPMSGGERVCLGAVAILACLGVAGFLL